MQPALQFESQSTDSLRGRRHLRPVGRALTEASRSLHFEGVSLLNAALIVSGRGTFERALAVFSRGANLAVLARVHLALNSRSARDSSRRASWPTNGRPSGAQGCLIAKPVKWRAATAYRVLESNSPMSRSGSETSTRSAASWTSLGESIRTSTYSSLSRVRGVCRNQGKRDFDAARSSGSSTAEWSAPQRRARAAEPTARDSRACRPCMRRSRGVRGSSTTALATCLSAKMHASGARVASSGVGRHLRPAIEVGHQLRLVATLPLHDLVCRRIACQQALDRLDDDARHGWSLQEAAMRTRSMAAGHPSGVAEAWSLAGLARAPISTRVGEPGRTSMLLAQIASSRPWISTDRRLARSRWRVGLRRRVPSTTLVASQSASGPNASVGGHDHAQGARAPLLPADAAAIRRDPRGSHGRAVARHRSRRRSQLL